MTTKTKPRPHGSAAYKLAKKGWVEALYALSRSSLEDTADQAECVRQVEQANRRLGTAWA